MASPVLPPSKRRRVTLACSLCRRRKSRVSIGLAVYERDFGNRTADITLVSVPFHSAAVITLAHYAKSWAQIANTQIALLLLI